MAKKKKETKLPKKEESMPFRIKALIVVLIISNICIFVFFGLWLILALGLNNGSK
jgi:hypothetical protein